MSDTNSGDITVQEKVFSWSKQRKIRGLNEQFCGAVSYVIWYILYCPGNFIKTLKNNLNHILTEHFDNTLVPICSLRQF